MKLLVGNFKMNLCESDIKEYLDYIDECDINSINNMVFCPPNIYLKDFINKKVLVGSQNVSEFNNGAYTGEISASQLRSIGVKYSIIGHSERRQLFNENSSVNEKIKRLNENNIIPILCIGESKEEYDSNRTKIVLKEEIDYAFKDNNIDNIIIAYEPIWSIGTGLIPKLEEINDIMIFIKEYVYNHYNINIKVLYGGSVNTKNINDLEKVKSIDGYLVGGCSIKYKDFFELEDVLNKA